MPKVNSSVLFGSDAFRLPLLRGFAEKTSKRFLSVLNESGRSTLYRPALKALIAYLCDGKNYLDETLDLQECESTYISAIGKIGKLYVAEYVFSETQKHLACFDCEKAQFLFAGITENNGLSYKPYILDYKDGRNGTVLWLAMLPYITTASNELQTVLMNLSSNTPNDNLWDEYKALANNNMTGKTKLSNSVISQCFIFCDAIYHSVDRQGFADEIKVDIDSNGVCPPVPTDLTAYKTFDAVISGEFSLNEFCSNPDSKKTAKSYRVTPDELFCKYAINENMTDAEKAMVPKMYDQYVVPKWVLKAAYSIKHQHNMTLTAAVKQNTIGVFGPPGTGKTDGAKAIASALGLPCVEISCSANTEEGDFTGKLIPKLSKQQNTTEMYKTYKEVLDFAEMSPDTVYTDLTGEQKEDATVEDCLEAYALSRTHNNNSNSIEYEFIESDFIKAVQNGWLVIIEEPTNIRDNGVLILLNSLADGHQSITLPTGKKVKRHPNTIIVFAANVDEANCNELQASTLSRINPIYRINAPTAEEMMKRVKAQTGFTDSAILSQMVKVVITLAKYCSEHGLPGSCSVRDFMAWVLQYQTAIDYEPSLNPSAALKESALETIVPSASPHQEDIDDITRDILDTML